MFKHRYLNTIHCKVWSLKLREHDNSNSYISNSDNSNSDNSNTTIQIPTTQILTIQI